MSLPQALTATTQLARRLEQRQLAARRTKTRAVEVERLASIQPKAFAGQGKALCEQFSKSALTTKTLTEATVIQRTTATLTDQAEHMLGTLRVMGVQPFRKQRRHLTRQTQQHIIGALRAGLFGRR